MNTEAKIKDLITLTGNLADLLERENIALREHRPADVAGLLNEKQTLSRVYEARIIRFGKLTETPDAFKDMNPELLERLKALGGKVNALMDVNERLLKVAIEANQRVMEAIANAVKGNNPGPGVYSASGVVRDDPGKAGSMTSPVSVNRSL